MTTCPVTLSMHFQASDATGAASSLTMSADMSNPIVSVTVHEFGNEPHQPQTQPSHSQLPSQRVQQYDFVGPGPGAVQPYHHIHQDPSMEGQPLNPGTSASGNQVTEL